MRARCANDQPKSPKASRGQRIAVDLKVDADTSAIAAGHDPCVRELLNEPKFVRRAKHPSNEDTFLFGQRAPGARQD
jgi:hypothetical protein